MSDEFGIIEVNLSEEDRRLLIKSYLDNRLTAASVNTFYESLNENVNLGEPACILQALYDATLNEAIIMALQKTMDTIDLSESDVADIHDNENDEPEVKVVTQFVHTKLGTLAQQVFDTEIKECCVEDALLYAVFKEMENK